MDVIIVLVFYVKHKYTVTDFDDKPKLNNDIKKHK